APSRSSSFDSSHFRARSTICFTSGLSGVVANERAGKQQTAASARPPTVIRRKLRKMLAAKGIGSVRKVSSAMLPADSRGRQEFFTQSISFRPYVSGATSGSRLGRSGLAMGLSDLLLGSCHIYLYVSSPTSSY